MDIFESGKITSAYLKMICEAEETVDVNTTDAAVSTETEAPSAQSTEEPKDNTHKLTIEGNPAVWIGTYGNYNNGSLGGIGEASGWIDLTTFSDADEFHEWLDEQADGRDVEWMFQDFQYFPRSLYSESDIDKVWDYIDFKDSTYLDDEHVDALLEEYDFDELKRLDDAGQIRVYSKCRSMGDVAQQMVEEEGVEIFPDHMYQNAFDYEGFGRDISIDWDSSAYEGKDAYETFGVSEDDDQALGEAYVNEMYGDISELGKDTILQYIDFNVLGRDLEMDGNWIQSGEDMIEVF